MKVEYIKVGPIKTNCYFLIKEKECIIVDPGDEKEKIMKKINELGVKPIKILITHNHFDHVLARTSIQEEYQIESLSYDHYENDEKIYKIGDFKFKMISTKGHTTDSITYYFEEENRMLTGDFLFKETVGRWDLETSSEIEMYQSIDKIKTYPKDIKIYPGHGLKTTLENEMKNNPFFIQ